ncbi:MAG: TonB-dependent receptor [Hymenobacteraceae bacterium]|nr:TonB-dependent receptor [Hymenobacteraceae bacterium]
MRRCYHYLYSIVLKINAFTQRLISLPALLLTAPATLAQQAAPAVSVAAATGHITGVVLDSATRQPVPYATVVLLSSEPTATKPLTGVGANVEGQFSIEKVAPGTYRVRAQYVGYASQTRPVTVAAGLVEAGVFALPTTSQQLADVVVEGQKPMVEVKPDRLIYNAEQDVTNAGGTAADVLRKAPLLSIDGDGNPKLRGSANFRVLINNKPSPTLASNLAEALKSIPAEQIKSVEVITTPPAQYDGEGTAGIINIVLKKGVDRGLNGSIGASAGNRNTSVNGSLNGKKGKVGFSSWVGAGQWFGPSRSLRDRTDYAVDAVSGQRTPLGQLTQRGRGKFGGHWMYGSFGVDYDPAENHSFSLAGSLNTYNGDGQQDLFNQYQALDATRNQLFTRATTNVFSGFNGELTGTYTRTFKNQPRREWSILGQAGRNAGTFGYDLDQYASAAAGPVNEATYREHSRGRTPGGEYTVQTNYTHPFTDRMTLETGLKSIWRHTGSVADVTAFRAGQSPDFVAVPERRTDFGYDQQVQAAYATYSFGLGKKVNVSLGTRAERTALQADFRTTTTRFSQHYVSVLPNGSVQYSLSDKTSLRGVYSRRITRPYIDYLNPFVDRSDSLNLSYGNPRLNPELTDSYELSYNTLIKEATLTVSASARRTDNAIESVRLPTETVGVTASTFANVAANAFYQLNVYGSLKPLKDWEISGGPDVQYVVRKSPVLGINRRAGFTASGNLNTSYKLPQEITIQAFANYSLPSPDLQGRGSAWLWYSVGVKKKLFDKKADLSVNFSNPFNAYWAYRNTLSTPTFTEYGEGRNYQRAVRVGFTWRFGQVQQNRQRKSISNDDKKGGGGGGQQGGGQ